MKLYDVPNVDHPLMLDEDYAASQGYKEHVDDDDKPEPKSKRKG